MKINKKCLICFSLVLLILFWCMYSPRSINNNTTYINGYKWNTINTQKDFDIKVNSVKIIDEKNLKVILEEDFDKYVKIKNEMIYGYIVNVSLKKTTENQNNQWDIGSIALSTGTFYNKVNYYGTKKINQNLDKVRNLKKNEKTSLSLLFTANESLMSKNNFENIRKLEYYIVLSTKPTYQKLKVNVISD
ncbi:hypothetical protein [Vagococcus fluvialis]|uniref:hypothetical protein n=1 Tax=Vagococcus fluvialis TaxID=2738 RepID=UPI002033A037|nr:hypothetical protein [Vagococcus fluvialis]MCM2139491.1 hypothetical protein [Vagococcus fluvialis]